MISTEENKERTETIIDERQHATGVDRVILSGRVRQMSELHYRVQKINDKIVKGKLEDTLFPRKNFLYGFNEKGIKTAENIYDETGLNFEQFFDENNGKIIKANRYDSKGNLEYTAIYTNDENGKNLENCCRYANGDFMYSQSHTYDSNGNETEGIFKSKYEDACHRYINIYDENGFRTEHIPYDSKGREKHKIVYINNHKGHCLEERVYLPDGRLSNVFKSIYKFDADGNQIIPLRVVPTGGFHPHHTYEYEYDHHQNWIKRITLYNKIPIGICEREITYWGEPAKPLFVTITPPKKLTKYNQLKKEMEESKNKNSATAANKTTKEAKLDAAKVMWVAEMSKGDDFSAFRYYVALNDELPCEWNFTGQSIDAFALRDELIEYMDARVLHTYTSTYGERNARITKYTLGFPNNCYFLQAHQINAADADEYDSPDFINESNDNNGVVSIGQFRMIHPSDASGKRDRSFEGLLTHYMDACTLQKMEKRPEIYMVQVSNGNFALKSYPVDDGFEIKNLDGNYGYGFAKFHDELMDRFESETKGLVLFHGEPGTGKTYYIRHLLRSMCNKNKIVIYMPPNMVDHLVEPSFMTFISATVSLYSQDGYFCVLLIEDAEPLLAARSTDTRIQGVTNLLNMTDGLLNDMLNLQIICTFNVGLKKLDKALLRPGRLIARKEFKAMGALDANILAQQLGVKHHFTKPATLSEVYALQKNKNTLIHDVDENGANVSE